MAVVISRFGLGGITETWSGSMSSIEEILNRIIYFLSFTPLLWHIFVRWITYKGEDFELKHPPPEGVDLV